MKCVSLQLIRTLQQTKSCLYQDEFFLPSHKLINQSTRAFKMSRYNKRMKNVVSSGFATHRIEADSLTLVSLPVKVNLSPTCKVCDPSTFKCFISACKPMCLFPTSTNTSFPPLNAQNGGSGSPVVCNHAACRAA